MKQIVTLSALTVVTFLMSCTKELPKQAIIPGSPSAPESAAPSACSTSEGKETNALLIVPDLQINIQNPTLGYSYWYVYEVVPASGTLPQDTVLIHSSIVRQGSVFTADVTDDLSPSGGAFPLLLNHEYLIFGGSGFEFSTCFINSFVDEYLSVKFTNASHGKGVVDYNTCGGYFSVVSGGSNLNLAVRPQDWH